MRLSFLCASGSSKGASLGEGRSTIAPVLDQAGGSAAGGGTFTVVGAEGYLGAALCQRLGAAGARVIAIDRLTPDTELVGHVIWAAGVTHGAARRASATMRAHVGDLVAALDRHGFSSLLYLSSIGIYRDVPVGREEDAVSVKPADPADVYAISKLAGEALCLQHPDPAVRVARLATVIGGSLRRSGLVQDVVRQAVSTGRACFEEAPESQRDYIGVDRAVDLMIGIALRGRERIYNVASGRPRTHGELARALAEATLCELEWAGAGRLPRRQPIIDVQRVEREFGASDEDPLDCIRLLAALASADVKVPLESAEAGPSGTYPSRG